MYELRQEVDVGIVVLVIVDGKETPAIADERIDHFEHETQSFLAGVDGGSWGKVLKAIPELSKPIEALLLRNHEARNRPQSFR